MLTGDPFGIGTRGHAIHSSLDRSQRYTIVAIGD
jgi:hypothetical protein